MEYAPKGDLASFIKSQGILSYDIAKFYTSEIVSALEYMRRKNIAHRDLKPENIVIDSKWHIKIVFRK